MTERALLEAMQSLHGSGHAVGADLFEGVVGGTGRALKVRKLLVGGDTGDERGGYTSRGNALWAHSGVFDEAEKDRDDAKVAAWITTSSDHGGPERVSETYVLRPDDAVPWSVWNIRARGLRMRRSGMQRSSVPRVVRRLVEAPPPDGVADALQVPEGR